MPESDSVYQTHQAKWAKTLILALRQAGAGAFIVSPGSRSTPLVAALQALKVPFTLIIDERAAGFYALGQAKLTGLPSVVICTSGSAAAHYFPALVEADESNTPLLVVSADRPLELQGNRAFQTIDQQRLFGAKVRLFMDLGLPEGSGTALSGLRRKAAQAVALSRFPKAGPVHLNFPARKPLEPPHSANPGTEERGSTRPATSSPPPTAYYPPRPFVSPAALEAAARVLSRARRPALVVGPHSPAFSIDRGAVIDFCTKTRWPLLAEASSGLRFGLPVEGELLHWDNFDLCLRALANRSDARDQLPDAVLQLGNVPTSSAWLRHVRGLPRVVVAPNDWPDPTNDAECLLQAEPNSTLSALASLLEPASPAFREAVERARRLAAEVVAHTLVQPQPANAVAPSADHFLHEGQPVAILGEQLDDGDLLALGNSGPIRLADTFIAASSKHVVCLSQRGANGIDGLIASAAGAASVHPGHTWLLLGDISFLHDVGSLKVLAEARPRLGVIILNNRGGRLFEQLPIHETATPEELEAWTTPHHLELFAIASSFGIASYQVGNPSEFKLALRRAREGQAPRVIDVTVSPSGTRDVYRELETALAAVL